MSARARLLLFLGSAVVVAAVLAWGASGLPGFGRYPGPYGDLLNARAVAQRHVTNVPTAVNFDYRGLDTLGEEFILFASVLGVSLLLRKDPREKTRPVPPSESGESVEWISRVLIGTMILVGVYVVLHGQITPGGGFHGGVIIGSASLLVFLALGAKAFFLTHPKELIEVVDATAAGGYAVVGLIGLLSGAAFLANVLPLGTTGDLLSGGTIPLINDLVGVEVGLAFSLLFHQFIGEMEVE